MKAPERDTLAPRAERVGYLPLDSVGGLAQTLFFNVCDLPEAPFAEGRDEMPRPPPWSLREIADSKLRSLRQPAVCSSSRSGTLILMTSSPPKKAP
jgi:hypothetical protein